MAEQIFPLWALLLFASIGTTILLGIIGLVVYLFRWNRKQVNNIDVVVMELTNNGVIPRVEIGRLDKRKGRGNRVVTAKFFGARSVKDDLGYNITDDDQLNSGMGRRRKFLIVAMKDKLTASLSAAIKENEFDEKEKELLTKAFKEYYSTSAVRLTDIPKTLSLRPIISEQTRFHIDATQDIAEIDGLDDKKHARRMLYASAGIFLFTLLICFILFIVFMQQGPQIAGDMLAKTAAKETLGGVVPSILPG